MYNIINSVFIICIYLKPFLSRFSTENAEMELLEVSCESRGPGGAFLEAGGAHGGHSKGSHSPCAKYHPEKKTGAMMCTTPSETQKWSIVNI